MRGKKFKKKKIRKKKKKTRSKIYIYIYGERDVIEKREGMGKIDVNMEEISSIIYYT